MTELQTYLQSYFGIETKQLATIADLFKPQIIKKGDFHTKMDSYCTQMSFLRSGYMRIYAYADGKEITQWISKEGHFVTELGSIFFEMPARFHIQAMTDCELYTISKTDYQSIGNRVSEWERLEKLFLARCFMTLESRVFSFLSKSAEERYLELFEQNSTLFNEIPLQYLASMLGMTPETLSRIRKKQTS